MFNGSMFRKLRHNIDIGLLLLFCWPKTWKGIFFPLKSVRIPNGMGKKDLERKGKDTILLNLFGNCYDPRPFSSADIYKLIFLPSSIEKP